MRCSQKEHYFLIDVVKKIIDAVFLVYHISHLVYDPVHVSLVNLLLHEHIVEHSDKGGILLLLGLVLG